MFKAVLSTTVLPLDGTYKIETVGIVVRCPICQGEGNIYPGIDEVEECGLCMGQGKTLLDLSGVPNYVGHPDTKAIVESLGATQVPTKLFPGLQPGEQAIAFPIQQGKSTRKDEGFSSPHQEVKLEDLQVRVITRLE